MGEGEVEEQKKIVRLYDELHRGHYALIINKIEIFKGRLFVLPLR